MKVLNYFEPYEGDKPYIFISYAHADSPAVMQVIGDMYEKGYRIWYDEGIEIGSEWPECIASHLTSAHLVIAFLSNAYMKSDNCRREMHYALTKRIKTINVFLEDTQMTPGMEMQTGNIFALMKQNMTDPVFFEKLYSAPLLNSEAFVGDAPGKPAEQSGELSKKKPGKKAEKKQKNSEKKQRPVPDAATKQRKKRKARRIVLLCVFVLLLAAVITLGIVGHFTGLTERVIISLETKPVEKLPGSTEAQFKNSILEAAAREYCGIAQGTVTVSDLAGLTELYIIGEEYWLEEPAEELTDGSVPEGGTGGIRDLSDLAYFTGLRKLVLNGQYLSSLETMPASNLEILDLSGCKLASLQGIGALPKLRELVTDGCPVTELGDVNRCLQLRRLSLEGSHISDFSSLKPLIKLTEVSVSNCNIDSIKVVLKIGALTKLSLTDCDLRGRFFRALDREKGLVSLTLKDCQLSDTDNLDDFKGLTELYLIRSGASLDWSQLAELRVLSRVYIDSSMSDAIYRALDGSDTEIILIEN